MTRLKAVPRMGWLLRGVRDVESVAAHSFGVAFITMILADRAREKGMDVDAEKAIRMALLHDMTESKTGDLPYTIKKYFDKEALKLADEKVATEMLWRWSPPGGSYLDLWREYEHRTSLEARIVKAADKIDLLFQALEYEKGGARSLDEFWESAEDDFAKLGISELIEDLISDAKAERK